MAESEKKEHGMGSRGQLASWWNGAVAEARMQVSQHSVELKVQLLTGREGVQVGEVSGWSTDMSPVYRPRMTLAKWSAEDITENCQRQSIIRWEIENTFSKDIFWFLYWDCLLGSDASTHHAESKESCYLLQHASKKTAVKAKASTNFIIDAHTRGFPRPLLQIWYWKTKRKTCIQGAKWPTNMIHRGGNQGHRYVRRGRQTQSSLEHREIFQTLFKDTSIVTILTRAKFYFLKTHCLV